MRTGSLASFRRRFLVCAAAPVLALASAAGAGDILFVDILNFIDPDGNSIRRIGTDGNNLVTVVPTGGGARGLDVDQAAGKVYWCDVDNFAIRRANLDGSGQEDVLASGIVFPSVLRLDVAAARMYWGDQVTEELLTCDTQGLAPAPVLGTVFNRGLAIDAAAGRVYWTTSITQSSGRIMRANLDGTDPIIIRQENSSKPGSLALDHAAGKLYWTDPIAKTIRSCDLDGNNVELVYQMPAFFSPRAVAVDPSNGQVFFSADLPQEEGPTTGDIYAMSLDGAGPYIVMSGLGVVNDMVILSDDVGEPCIADFDENTVVEVPDIFEFLTAWFAGDLRADVDGTPGLGVPDIFFFLTAWFEGCD